MRKSLVVLVGIGLTACGQGNGVTDSPLAVAEAQTASVDEFLARANSEIDAMDLEQGAAAWVSVTYINKDTALLSAKANARLGELMLGLIHESKQHHGSEMDAGTARHLALLLRAGYMPDHISPPSDPDKLAEVTSLQRKMNGLYGSAKYCPGGDESCRTLEELSDIMRLSRDYDEQLEAWSGWRSVTKSMRGDYQRFVELSTIGARELGFNDMGAMWRSGYDMSPAAFEEEAERLWGQVKPLYDALHCYVRDRLADTYGEDRVSREGPIPAHLLGNMWSQDWKEIYELLEPYPGALELDVGGALEGQGYDAVRMTRTAETFFTSLGMPALPATFWDRSMLTEPRDRDVVCHASAWTLNNAEKDVRIKMCIDPTEEDFTVIHHELGHVYYYLAYQPLPNLYRKGANDGFHEGIGDTLVLSMTPGYYNAIGLMEQGEMTEQAVINQQMKAALDKIAFLPFGKLVDQWRWQVFSGEVPPERYNEAWWALRTKYQGIAPPVERNERDFDPGAKFHVPNNTPYTRYFLAHILQYQFHKALCEVAGHDGPLYSCSIYGSKAAGDKLWTMMQAGTSQPWQDTLEAAIGTREMDGSAIIDYFQPLMGWLEERNQGKTCGW